MLDFFLEIIERITGCVLSTRLRSGRGSIAQKFPFGRFRLIQRIAFWTDGTTQGRTLLKRRLALIADMLSVAKVWSALPIAPQAVMAGNVGQ